MSANAATQNNFITRLRGSHASVHRMAKWFELRGWKVKIPPSTEAPSHAEWKDHVDGGDLFIAGNPLNGWERVEIKQSKILFTTAQSFRYPDFLICAQHSFDQAIIKPSYYVRLSSNGTHAASLVVRTTQSQWTVRPVLDKERGTWQDCYHVPKHLVQFFKL